VFNFVDLCVLALLGASALLAFSRGFVKEILSILSWAGAVLATVFLFGSGRAIARQYIPQPILADIAAAATIFVVTLFLCGILNNMLSKSVRGSAMGALDRSLGLVFGLGRGIVVVSFAYLLMVWLLPDADLRPRAIQEARTLPLIARSAAILQNLLPAGIFEEGAAAVDQSLKHLEKGKALNDAYQALTTPDSDGKAANPPSSTQPDMSNPDGQASGSGYKDAERKDLDRLIQSSP